MGRPRITLTFVVAGLASGCALTGTSAPPLTGPSELGLSLLLRATPDVLIQDGISRSRVSVAVRNEIGQPVRGLNLTVEVDGDEPAVDSGRLSQRAVTTDDSGQASVFYTAPRSALGTPPAARTVGIIVTPVGTNYASALPRAVLIRLLPPSAIP
jgi:hypothetical protein